jgi:hypothetical protein
MWHAKAFRAHSKNGRGILNRSNSRPFLNGRELLKRSRVPSAGMTEGFDAGTAPLDLDAIERDLADVEVALSRLDSGTYWTDEVTGAPLPSDRLAENPTIRRAV